MITRTCSIGGWEQ